MNPFLMGILAALESVSIQINHCTPSRDFAMEKMRQVDVTHIMVHQQRDGIGYGNIELTHSGGEGSQIPYAVKLVNTRHEPFNGRGMFKDVDHWMECEL